MRPRNPLSAPRAGLAAACCAHESIAAAPCGCQGPTASAPVEGAPWARWLLWALAGLALYGLLEPLARAITFQGLGLQPGTRLGEAVAFFLYDAPKLLLLLMAATFVVTFLQSFLDPQRIREVLARRSGILGNLLAGLLGVVTPFCSCSAVPLFIGLMRAGVPLGVTFSYLVSAPMVNEVALLLLLAVFGWRIAMLYAITGITVALVSGWLLGRLHLESQVEPWIQAETAATHAASPQLSLQERLALGIQAARTTVAKVWPHVLVGIAFGAVIHGYLPENLLARVMGHQVWWGVPVAVLIGVPLYAGTAVVLPLAQTLLAKGAALGTVLAFMMAVTALSLPEMILLRRVLRLRLLLLFVGIVAAGILGVGFLFNLAL